MRASAPGRARGDSTRVHLGPEHPDEREVAVALPVVEAVSDDEAVRDGEAEVIDRDLHQPAGRLVEERADAQRGGVLPVQVADEVVEREPGVDDVLDDEDVATLNGAREVLEDA